MYSLHNIGTLVHRTIPVCVLCCTIYIYIASVVHTCIIGLALLCMYIVRVHEYKVQKVHIVELLYIRTTTGAVNLELSHLLS